MFTPLIKKLGLVKNLLSHEETRELIAKAQKGDLEARNKIVEHNGGLIGRYAKLYRARKTILEYDDLFQEGIIGLIRAIELFDLSTDYKFSTYATWWIKQHVYRAMDNNTEGIRVPIYIHAKVRIIRKKIEKRTPLSKKEKALWAIYENSHSVSLDSKIIPSNPISGTYHDLLESPMMESQELIKYDLNALINKVGVSKRNKTIFRRRSGGERLRAIGRDFNITRERVRQIEKDFRERLDNMMKKEKK